MENQNQQQCSLCQLNLENTIPQMTLLCNHTFHTNCFLHDWHGLYGGWEDNRCPTCREQIIVINRDEAREQRRQKKAADDLKMYTRFTEIDGAIADLKFMKKQYRILRIKKSVFLRLARSKKRLFREEAGPVNQILQDIRTKYKKQIHESVQQKELHVARRNFTTYMNRFNRKYTADNVSFADACGVSQLNLPTWWSIYADLRANSWAVARMFRLW
jgi:hypothetical protein